ncbi:RHS repeat domain-containing protein [Haliscomenobacter sp.]|uniref:RHS repeat domain-containing protein n=1 Tax=Haliscomenobacter sp. TaxID=2717303 RepID=UPI0035933E12
MKTKSSFILYILVLLYGLPSTLLAQPVNKYLQDVNMPSPSAGSLGKYGEVPVSYFTGVPNISIPIHTLREGPLSLPVTLNYHASGIKTAEPASWVGTGWSLNAGGMISRTVLHIRDEDAAKGYLALGAGLQYSGSDVTEAYNGTKDSEPDIFSFNFMGYSGKFSRDATTSTWRIVPKQDLKIEHGTNLESFKITTPDGSIYHFGNLEFTDPTLAGGERYISGWYLTRIESPDLKYAINLTYTADKYTFRSPATTAYYKNAGTNPGSTCTSTGITMPSPFKIAQTYYYKNYIDGLRLSSISTSTETLNFVANTTRTDLEPYSTGVPKQLNQITLNTGSGTNTYCIKWDFSYDYFVDNSSNQCTSTASDPHCQRLKLTQIKEQSCDGADQKEPYVFEYEGATVVVNGQNKQFLPNVLSKATDHWGFYNGVTTNNGLNVSVPPTTLNFGSFGVQTYGSANRNTNEAEMQKGTLKKITYPTGGNTSFVYEANDYQELTTVYTRQYVVDNLTNCFQANGICCSPSQPVATATFTSTVDIAVDSFSLEMTSTNCTSPQYCYAGPVSVSIEVRYNGNNQLLTVYNFNLSPGESYGKVIQKLSTLYNGFQTGIAYKFVLCASGGKGVFSIFKSNPSNQYVTTKVGGLRVKEIRSNDGVSAANDVVKTYEYLSDGAPQSSGKLFYKPVYGLALSGGVGSYTHTYFYFQDIAVVPMGAYDGYHIGYQRVTENYNGNGKTIYAYLTEEPASITPTAYPTPPGLAAISRGEVISTITTNAGGLLLEQTSSTQNNDIYTNTNSIAFKIAKTKLCTNQFLVGNTQYSPRTAPYRVATQTVYKDGISTTTTYNYANASAGHLAPTAATFTNSDGKTSVTNYYYAHEMSNRSGASPAYAELKNRNMITIPLEETESIAGVQVKGTRTEYGFFNNLGSNVAAAGANIHPYPYKFWNYEMTWNASNVVSISGSDGWVLRGTVNSYHPDSGSGKAYPKQFTQTGWSPETYEWQNGLLAQKTYEQHTQTYTYLTNTRLLGSSTSVDGQESYFTYDGLMRLKKAESRKVGTIANVTTNYTYGFKNAQNLRNFVKSITNFTAVSNSNLTQKGMVQYFDGLGRLIQDVKIKYQPNKGAAGQSFTTFDVAVNYTYDNRGRLVSTSNPFVGAAQDGSYATIPGSWPTLTTQYEASPLGRPISTTSQLGYATTVNYGSNQSTIATPTGINYSANTLYETKVTDPDNRVSYSYTDKWGRLVLSRQTNTSNTSPADTYTVYDDKDRVKEVYPPSTGASNTDLIFKYLYDVADNLTYKKIPDAAAVQFRYNTKDLPVFIQDGNLANHMVGMTLAPRCIGTKYDNYGRVIETGYVDGFPTDTSPGFSFLESLSKNYYDGSDGTNTQAGAQYKGRVRRSLLKVLDYTPSTWIDTYYTYDAHGRVTNTSSNNLLNPTASAAESVNFTYDWADNILTESKSHTTGGAAGTPAIALLNEYQYDGNGRKINFITTISGIGQHVAEYNYNYRDELVERNLHANQVAGAWGWLQSVDYSYNNQGWLTSINDWQTSATVNTPASCTPPMPNPPSPTRTYYNEANDLFMLDLRYNQPETGIAGLTAAPPQKAGNISQIIYRVRGREASIMSYSYDYLSRLSTSTFHNYSDAGVISGTNNYNENLTYDLRGNIQTLQRTGFYQNGGTCTYGQIDNLTYSYPSSPASNKVHKILDGTTTAGDAKSRGFNGLLSTADNSLTYDANGNLNKNLHKNSSSITYNHLNLPKLITFSTGNTIEFLYDAAGNKLRKTTKTGATVQYVQDYFPGGIEYRQTGTGAKRVESVYHAEGRYYNTNVDASNTIAWRKEYSFRDHLGNTRLAFTDRNANGIVDITGTASTSDILQENHYYSFGLAFEGAWLQNDAGVRDNQYMYNGKELHSDFGLGMYAYGARYYDPSIGRFIGVDPISGEFPFVTTFNYAENEPIANIDLHGLQKVGVNDLARIVGLPESDKGIVKPASARMRESSPFKAGVKDASFIVLELMGINTIDNAIATWLDPNASLGEKIAAGGEVAQSMLSSTKRGTKKNSVGKYEVGDYDDLQRRSVAGDGLDLHHVPQKKPAGQVIDGYDKKNGPAIALPQRVHKTIPTKKGEYEGTARDQLAKDSRDLRKAGVSNDKVKEIIDYNKKKYPNSYEKE